MSKMEAIVMPNEPTPATTEPTENQPPSHPLQAVIRVATKSDTSIILKLIHQLALFEKLSHLVKATEDDLTSTLFTNSPPFTSCTIFLLEVVHPPPPPSSPISDPDAAEFRREGGGGVVAGYALLSPNYAPFLGKAGLYMEHLFVREPYRGMGMGKMLMKEVATQAVRLGYGRVDWVVLDWNQDAIGFYRRIGADVMEEYRLCRLTGDSLLSYATNN